jgi:hypothetical protein
MIQRARAPGPGGTPRRPNLVERLGREQHRPRGLRDVDHVPAPFI